MWKEKIWVDRMTFLYSPSTINGFEVLFSTSAEYAIIYEHPDSLFLRNDAVRRCTSMNKTHFFIASGFVVATLLTSCGAAKITDEQKAQIAELRRQQASLGEKIKIRQTEIARLETEIADRERAVTKCNEEKLALEQRLAKYPNAWPDYTEPAKDTVKTNTGKKK